MPGYKLLVHPHSIYALLLPRLPFVNLGMQYAWQMKRQCSSASLYIFELTQIDHPVLHHTDGLDVVSMVSLFPNIRTFVVSDVEAIKFITKERNKFMKPLSIYAALGMYGMNVGITEGSDWTRHRRIVAGPVLSDTLNKRAWDETCRTMDLCLDDFNVKMSASARTSIQVPNITELMLKVSSMSLFGLQFS